jgi:phosphoglycolate phosphatase-like HAD superfamily hydrolase
MKLTPFPPPLFPSPSPKLVISDFDATLTDRYVWIHEVHKLAVSKTKQHLIDQGYLVNFVPLPQGQLIAMIKAKAPNPLVARWTGVPPEGIDYFCQMVNEFNHSNGIDALIPRTKEALCFLRDHGIRVAIASFRPQNDVVQNLFCHHLIPFVDAVYAPPFKLDFGKYNLVQIKMDYFRRALYDFSVSPPESVAIGDSPVELEAGHNLGMLTIGVFTGFSNYDELVSCKPNCLERDFWSATQSQCLFQKVGLQI